MRVNGRSLWLGGGIVGAILIVLASWLLFIHPKLADADQARADAASTRRSNDALLARVATLRTKSEQLDSYRASLRTALAALPEDSGLPAFTRELTAAAAANDVALGGITVGGISAMSGSGGTASPSTGGSAQPAGRSVYSIQVSITAAGSLAHERAFLDAIQYQGPRRVLITSSAFTPGSDSASGSIDEASRLTAQLTIYSAPRSSAERAALTKLLTGASGD